MTTLPPLRFPELVVRCPWCRAAPGELCTTGGRHRRDLAHTARRSAWAVSVAVCPTCQTPPGTPCRDTNQRPMDEVHPARDAEAVRTTPPARTPRVQALGEQLDLTDTEGTP